jgi:hypothetical protein
MGKTSKMTAALIVAAVWMLSCAVLQGAELGFDNMVRAIAIVVFENVRPIAHAAPDLWRAHGRGLGSANLRRWL